MARVLALAFLILLSPVLLLISCAVFLEDGWPVVFRQQRVGREGKLFELLKFRSMRRNDIGTQVTRRGDPRITLVGRFIRRYKLDEIPQLWNVFRGDICFIGSRPEVPFFVDLSDPLWKATLSKAPGITSLATLLYREEEQLLSQIPEPVAHYRAVVLPDKLRLDLGYFQRRSFLSDIRLLWLTLLFSLLPSAYNAEELRRRLSPEDCVL